MRLHLATQLQKIVFVTEDEAERLARVAPASARRKWVDAGARAVVSYNCYHQMWASTVHGVTPHDVRELIPAEDFPGIAHCARAALARSPRGTGVRIFVDACRVYIKSNGREEIIGVVV